MRQQVAGDARSRNAHVEAPQPLAALRQVLGDRPVLQELRAVVEDLAQPPFVDQLLCQGHGGNAAVIVPDHVGNARALHRLHHLGGFGSGAAERLFAHHHLAGLCGGDGDFHVRIVGTGDVDQVDRLVVDELPPIGDARFIAPLLGEGLGLVRAPRADRLQHRLVAEVEEMRRLGEGVGMGAAHEAIAHHADVEWLLRHWVSPPIHARRAP